MLLNFYLNEQNNFDFEVPETLTIDTTEYMSLQEEVYDYSDVDIYSLYESSEMILESKITEAAKKVWDSIIGFLKKIMDVIKNTFAKIKKYFKNKINSKENTNTPIKNIDEGIANMEKKESEIEKEIEKKGIEFKKAKKSVKNPYFDSEKELAKKIEQKKREYRQMYNEFGDRADVIETKYNSNKGDKKIVSETIHEYYKLHNEISNYIKKILNDTFYPEIEETCSTFRLSLTTIRIKVSKIKSAYNELNIKEKSKEKIEIELYTINSISFLVDDIKMLNSTTRNIKRIFDDVVSNKSSSQSISNYIFSEYLEETDFNSYKEKYVVKIKQNLSLTEIENYKNKLFKYLELINGQISKKIKSTNELKNTLVDKNEISIAQTLITISSNIMSLVVMMINKNLSSIIKLKLY